MKALVSIVMGSISDLPVMEKAADFLNELEIPFEMRTLSAHRTPGAVAEFAQQAKGNHSRCRYGCGSARCYRSEYHAASYWRSNQ